MDEKGLAEYIWIDGTEPTARLRSKTKVLDDCDEGVCPDWNFDGSSTNQADGDDSDVKLRPVFVVKDPFRKGKNWLVLCECLTHDNVPIKSNKRFNLMNLLNNGVREKYEPWVGFEQEYTLIDNKTGRPLGFPKIEGLYPAPQGPYYCGTNIPGRGIMEKHMKYCIKSSLSITGTNAEVMIGQWEYQIGYEDPLIVSDYLWISRYILERIAEENDLGVSLENKPVKGDWNGTGCHTNFSTKQMRKPGGIGEIHSAIEKLKNRHEKHVNVYGDGLEERLTGLHETCSIYEFKWGVADRGASIRIPKAVDRENRGYFEDRRPGANIDPYVVSDMILRTVCDA